VSDTRRNLLIVVGLLLAMAVKYMGVATGLPVAAAWTAAVTTLCAFWWVTEPIPIPATSLIPFAAFPLLGVLTDKQVAGAYGHNMILLLLGGFVLSTAMERSGAHRRLALGLVGLVGGKGGRRLVLGFMLATAGISMWISNTATVLMLLPVALAVLEQDKDGKLAVPLLLGMAYAGSIGGLATPVGTPPNIIFMGAYEASTGKVLSFTDWMSVGLPVTVLMLPLMWFVLTRGLGKPKPMDLPKSGPWRPAERRVLVVFGLTALAWVTRVEPFGGWSGLSPMLAGVGDATVALAAVVVLFVIPDGDGGRMLDWETANRIPWGLLILFGGGLAIAKAFGESGLSTQLGDVVSGMATWNIVVMILAICLFVTFVTEVTSNTATTTVLMPILAAAGIGAGVEPALLMVPAAMSASCAFMLPVATPPNAIAFGTGYVTVRQMAREGFWLNIIGVIVVTLVCYFGLPF
jgi:solute carrier family 13 (sodium-dependent dicarboxylate transporter), member 2/3/5